MPKYTTWGSVRGGCDHLHQSRSAARECQRRDQVGAAALGGYSDRTVRRIQSRKDIRSYDTTMGPGTLVPSPDDDYDV